VKRHLIAFFVFLLVAVAANAQSTTVSGTITDAGGQAWNNGTYSFTFKPSPSNPTGQYYWNGAPFSSSQTIQGDLDGSAHFSVSVPSNTSITPSGSTWTLQLCSAATATNGCNVSSLTVTGATQSVSTIVPPAVVVDLSTPLQNATAYIDGEVTGARTGQQYFNLSDGTQHVCTGFPPCTWVSVGGSSASILPLNNTFTGVNTFTQTIHGNISGNAATATNATNATNLVGPGSISGTFSGNPTLTGNLTATAGQNKAVLALANNVVHVNTTGPYTTLALAVAACPTGSGQGCHVIVDEGVILNNVPAITLGPQSAGTPMVCQNWYAFILELSAYTHLILNGPITLGCGAYIVGANRDGSYIEAGSSFAPAGPMVVIGDNVHNIDAQVRNVTLNCNLITNCQGGITATGINENTSFDHLYVVNYNTYCIKINGAGPVNLATTNFYIFDNQCAAGSNTADGLLLIDTGTDLIARNTIVTNTGGQSSGAGIHVTGTTSGFQGHSIIMTHCEEHNDCILFDGNQGGNITNVDAENGTVNAVRIAASANGGVTAQYVRNNANSNSFPTLINQVTGTNLSSALNAGGNVLYYGWQINQTEWWVDAFGMHTPATIVSNPTFSATGCGVTAITGGATAGSYQSVTAGSCNIGITFGGSTSSVTAPHGWVCDATDITTLGDAKEVVQISSNTRSVTLHEGTVAANDIIVFKCTGY
jgi:hypothetical protein